MKEYSKVFVAYTTRDGLVTHSLLDRVNRNLKEVCLPFIHAAMPNYSEVNQFKVMKELLSSHAFILIDSPSIQKSPWVRLELFLARVMLMPVIRVNVETFLSTIGKGLTMP